MINIASPIIGESEKQLIAEVLESKILASGKYVEKFEGLFANYCRTKFAIASSNGTTALHSALLACGVKEGDKVAVTAFSFIATANSILYCRAKPVFVDIDPKTFNMDLDALEQTLKKEKNIKAVILVHLYGLMSDMDKISALRDKYGFKLIEDCAQAHGAQYKNTRAGSVGDASAFSFYATKNLMTGEGGMILTNNSKTDKLLRQITNHGRDGHSSFAVLGYNYRMTNLAAAIGIAQLSSLEERTDKRNENAKKYYENLNGLDFLTLPEVPVDFRHVFHQYTLRVKASLREEFMNHLKDNEIGCGIYYDTVMYKQPVYRKLGYKNGLCPQAEKAAKEVVSIPIHPSLSQKDIDKVIEAIRGFKK